MRKREKSYLCIIHFPLPAAHFFFIFFSSTRTCLDWWRTIARRRQTFALSLVVFRPPTKTKSDPLPTQPGRLIFHHFFVIYLFLVLCHQWHNVCTYLYHKQNLLHNFQQLKNCKQRKIYSHMEMKERKAYTLSLSSPHNSHKARPKWKMKFLFSPSN